MEQGKVCVEKGVIIEGGREGGRKAKGGREDGRARKGGRMRGTSGNLTPWKMSINIIDI